MDSITGRELKEWITENDILLKITREQSEVIIKALNYQGYELAIEHGKMYQVSVDQEGVHKRETLIDDVIDLASEINYEALEESREKLRKASHEGSKFSSELSNYTKHYQDGYLLNEAFKQTIYAKNIALLVEKIKNDNEERNHQMQPENQRKSVSR